MLDGLDETYFLKDQYYFYKLTKHPMLLNRLENAQSEDIPAIMREYELNQENKLLVKPELIERFAKRKLEKLL